MTKFAVQIKSNEKWVTKERPNSKEELQKFLAEPNELHGADVRILESSVDGASNKKRWTDVTNRFDLQKRNEVRARNVSSKTEPVRANGVKGFITDLAKTPSDLGVSFSMGDGGFSVGLLRNWFFALDRIGRLAILVAFPVWTFLALTGNLPPPME